MPTIDGKTEGTRFAHDVEIYDPSNGTVIASLASLANSIVPTPEPDIANVPTEGSADAEINADAINEILDALRSFGILG